MLLILSKFSFLRIQAKCCCNGLPTLLEMFSFKLLFFKKFWKTLERIILLFDKEMLSKDFLGLFRSKTRRDVWRKSFFHYFALSKYFFLSKYYSALQREGPLLVNIVAWNWKLWISNQDIFILSPTPKKN